MKLRVAALLALALTGCPTGGSNAGPLPISFSPAVLPGATVGVAYFQAFTPTGGRPPYRWHVVSGSLPPGLTLARTTGTLTGTPTRGGVSKTFSISLTDSQVVPGFFVRTFTLTIPALPSLDFSPAVLPVATLNVPYSQSFTPTGGLPPYTWVLTPGTLPAGLSHLSGTITGTPTSVDPTGPFTIRLSDSQVPPDVVQRVYTLNVNEFPPPVILPPSTYAAVVNKPFSKTLGAAGSAPPYTWSLVGGALPDGLALSGVGVISGTPTTLGGPVSAQIQVADSQPSPAVATKTFSFTVTAPVPRFAYVLNQGSGVISITTIDSTTGDLRHLSYFAIPQSSDLVASPDEKFLFASSNDGKIFSYIVNPEDGRLTQVTSAQVGNGPLEIAMHPAGSFLFTPCYFAGTVAAVPINPATGSLGTPASIPLANPRSVHLSPGGTRLYVTSDDDQIHVFGINPATGALTPEAVVATATNPSKMALSPDGAHLYVNHDFPDGLSTFTITPGTEVPVFNSTLPGSSQPQGLLVHPSGLLVYQLDGPGSAVRSYARNPATGALTSSTSTSTASSPKAMALSPSASLLWTVNLGSDDVSTFTVDGAGALTARPGRVRTRVDPLAIVVLSGAPATYSPRMAYVSDEGANCVRSYVIDDATGQLIPVGSTSTGATPQSPAIHPQGAFLYTPNFDAATVSQFSVSSTSGALTPLLDAGGVTGTRWLEIEPSGRFAYTSGSADDQIRWHSIHPASGTLGLLGNTTGGSGLHRTAVDPTGQFLFVPRFNTATIGSFVIDVFSGDLYGETAVFADLKPYSVVAHPSGRFVYASNQGSGITVHNVTPLTGELTPSGSPLVAAPKPGSLACDPLGRFLYMTDQISNVVYGFRINATNGLLTPNGALGCGVGGAGLDVDPSGRFLYVACRQSKTVEVLLIHPTVGTLQPVASIPAGTSPAWVRILGSLD